MHRTGRHRSAELLEECRGVLVTPTGDDVDEVVCEHEWNSLTLDSKFALEVSKEVAKVDVDELGRWWASFRYLSTNQSTIGTHTHLPVLLQHDVIRVSITDAQYVSGHTAAST